MEDVGGYTIIYQHILLELNTQKEPKGGYMKASKEEKKDIKKTLKKADPAIDLKKDIELLKALNKNSNEDILKQINEINLSIEDMTKRLNSLEELRPQLETTVNNVARIVQRMGLGNL